MARLLVVDDEPSIREFFEILLAREGYEVDVVAGGKEALEQLAERGYDLVITDLSMPEVDGMEVLEKVKQISPETLVLMITAYATTESAVEAMKRGAYDYLMKPFKVDEIRLVIKNALEKTTLVRENTALRREINLRKGFSKFIAVSEKMHKIFDLIERVASGRSSVLIVGESGTGKELVAKAIHENSPRAERPFVSINCAALPENLIESELFGYMRGAFTGATSNKMGLFEAANQGTFFFDEVGELPPATQAKLLRVLQERAVRRLGSTTSNSVDVRIVSATNSELDVAVRDGKFREDLYYRLNVIQIRVPPLRERPEDIPQLVQHFIQRFSTEHGKTVTGISPEAMNALTRYSFPGNVRELENVIDQCVALEADKRIEVSSLPDAVRSQVFSVSQSVRTEPISPEGVDLEREVDQYEKSLLLEALKTSGGVKKKAAQLLKISFRSMRYRLLKHGIEVGEDEVE